ncbi:MAG: class I SAM-dependent methyltransferase [Leptospirillia bacterium]
MSRRTIGLPNPLYRYLTDVSLREHPVLTELREVTAGLPDARMQTAPEQGQFMGFLARLTGACRVLEVGTFTGYSALAVALSLPDNGCVVTLDNDPEATTTAQVFWRKAGVSERIELRLGDALPSLDGMLAAGEAGHYDMAFIDADKVRYEDYYERCLALVRPGGLILVDNVLWGGRVADPKVTDDATRAIRAFNKARRDDDRVALSLVPIADGLTLLHIR